MVLTMLFNFFINHLIGRELHNSGNNNNNNNSPANTTSPLELSTYITNITNQWTSALKLSGLNGLFGMFNEFWNVFLRADKRYANSRKYEIIGNTRFEGKVAVITAGDKDIGAETATELARHGYKVIIGVKEVQSDAPTTSSGASNSIKVLKLDLSSLESVREFAKQVSKLEPKIDLLVNSGYTFEFKKVVTKDGFERNFAENYLGHFLLTNLLLNNLKKSENGRIVNTTSIMHYFGLMNFNDINNDRGLYIPTTANSQSMLSQVLFTRELSKRLIDTNITVYAVSPEIIRQHFNVPQNERLTELLNTVTNPTNGSQTILYVSMEDSLKNESGFYYTNLKKVHPLMCNGTDDTNAERLWALSENWVNLEEEYRVKSPVNDLKGRDISSHRLLPIDD